MECCPRKLVSLQQISAINALECMVDMDPRGRRSGSHPVAYPKEVVCPEPRRASSAPFVVDGVDKFCFKSQRNLSVPVHKGDAGLEILDIFLGKDRSDAGVDTSSPTSYFCGSPPVRTNNPLVHDVQFVRQTPGFTALSGNSHGSKSAKVESFTSSSCGASSFGGKPLVRIEGFASRSSETRCFVPALA